MVIVIKNNSNMPIYDQIKRQILNAIMSGEIKEGECLPSVRGLDGNLKFQRCEDLFQSKDAKIDDIST